MDTLDDIANRQTAPAADEEEKKRKNKKKALVGLAALLVAGGCSSAVCIGSRYIAPQPEPEVAVVVEKREIAPTPTEYLVPLSPTPTEAVQEPVDVREGWYGDYLGTSLGVLIRTGAGPTPNAYARSYDDMSFEDTRIWIEIQPPEKCYEPSGWGDIYCDENLSWGADTFYGHDVERQPLAGLTLYLPRDLGEAENLAISEDTIHITPDENHPYELHLVRTTDGVEGHFNISGRIINQWFPWHVVPQTVDFSARSALPQDFPRAR